MDYRLFGRTGVLVSPLRLEKVDADFYNSNDWMKARIGDKSEAVA